MLKVVYDSHIKLIRGFGITKTDRKLVKRFRFVLRNVIRLMNVLEPSSIVCYRFVRDGALIGYPDTDTHTDTHTDTRTDITTAEQSKLDQLILCVDGVHYFAPWIYEYRQKSSRILVYKKIDTDPNKCHTYKYLVHRSYAGSSDHTQQLQHPGGHLEYVEYLSNNTNTTYATAMPYVSSLLHQTNNMLTQLTDLTELTELAELTWAIYGGMREVMEESGLDLKPYYCSIELLKIGTKTFYFGVEVGSDVCELGPLQDYRSEVITYKRIESKAESEQTELDKFWLGACNDNTDHAWLVAADMLRFWDPTYASHVSDLISILQK